MRYLLDTDWVVSFLNGRRAAVELVATLGIIYDPTQSWCRTHECLTGTYCLSGALTY